MTLIDLINDVFISLAFILTPSTIYSKYITQELALKIDGTEQIFEPKSDLVLEMGDVIYIP